MKKLLLLMITLFGIVLLTACGGCDDGYEKNEDGECELIVTYDELSPDVEGQIDLLLWSGSGTRWEDIGHQDLTQDDLTAQNDAAAYAVAKEFNKLYPNVVINVLAVDGGPSDNGRIWAQEIVNYETTYQVHPSIWATVDLPGDIQDGLVADLSQFADDPIYQSFNPSIMEMMNYYGFQGGLPQYILPWGVYVNKELAEEQNLDVPDYDWDIDEYTDFVQNSEDDEYYGAVFNAIRIIETGTNDIVKSLFEGNTNPYVNLNSDEVRDLFPYLLEWQEDAVFGNASEEFISEAGWWGYFFFSKGKTLTYEGDPWMMGDCAMGDTEWWANCVSEDWDIYPRPSTDYVDNTVGIVLDPMAIYNACIADKNLTCSPEEELQIKLNYTFASFWIGDTVSWQARADQMFSDDGKYSSALNDSFPVTTGEVFEEQMNIWYQPVKHQRFSDANLMPGFHEVLRIYEEGQFWDVSDKAYPWFYNVEETRREILYEWKNYWDETVNGGVTTEDANFTDTIYGLLDGWNTDSNARFAEQFEKLKEGLKIYYGFTDEDFE